MARVNRVGESGEICFSVAYFNRCDFPFTPPLFNQKQHYSKAMRKAPQNELSLDSQDRERSTTRRFQNYRASAFDCNYWTSLCDIFALHLKSGLLSQVHKFCNGQLCAPCNVFHMRTSLSVMQPKTFVCHGFRANY